MALYGALARAVAVAGLTIKAVPHIPRGIKWFVVFLLALNIRNFPLAWHCTFCVLKRLAIHVLIFDFFTHKFVSFGHGIRLYSSAALLAIEEACLAS